jgi:hypothetical protein
MLCFNAKHLCSLVFILWDGNGVISHFRDNARVTCIQAESAGCARIDRD